mmetsp:Transcript_51755/g.129924  ORF Transcript_51755/g.129924 Transcript_51755/m.129924 type:complete len:352 (-) Transcript_51755:3286-4341(-)
MAEKTVMPKVNSGTSKQMKRPSLWTAADLYTFASLPSWDVITARFGTGNWSVSRSIKSSGAMHTVMLSSRATRLESAAMRKPSLTSWPTTTPSSLKTRSYLARRVRYTNAVDSDGASDTPMSVAGRRNTRRAAHPTASATDCSRRRTWQLGALITVASPAQLRPTAKGMVTSSMLSKHAPPPPRLSTQSHASARSTLLVCPNLHSVEVFVENTDAVVEAVCSAAASAGKSSVSPIENCEEKLASIHRPDVHVAFSQTPFSHLNGRSKTPPACAQSVGDLGLYRICGSSAWSAITTSRHTSNCMHAPSLVGMVSHRPLGACAQRPCVGALPSAQPMGVYSAISNSSQSAHVP